MNTKPTTLKRSGSHTKKINALLAKNRLTTDDITDLSPAERRCLELRATNVLSRLTGEKRDGFLSKIEQIIPESVRADVWEHNHLAISSAITRLFGRHGTMPNKCAIAEATGLSRQTVARHLKEYRQHPEFGTEMEQFKFMTGSVMGSVFKCANNGDIRAARLYFEMVGAINRQQGPALVTAQNNYIQINNTILRQENLKLLSAEQLQQIERIVMSKE